MYVFQETMRKILKIKNGKIVLSSLLTSKKDSTYLKDLLEKK